MKFNKPFTAGTCDTDNGATWSAWMNSDRLSTFPNSIGDFEKISVLTNAQRVAIPSLRTCVQAKATAIEGSVCTNDCINENNWSTTITQDVTISMEEGTFNQELKSIKL